ncbi:hypothetical protein BAY61_01550 [Prauserella marina]|uniref:Uncharacterized conserved protein, DUF305 family n=1 Tax=Prauserella marina TaxID=530584 RepID=A0A222VIZ5_9PSEU|nr:DUF305 domain-containing protein [Prauserella marina]ASR33890.1 hypothetical protein BAY61_01550 [Prauserella marina]PWV82485.1 uncharacterized protein (DUF305 family) [Prauserella marina]SDC70329.1 Uncharacterized conserved protein, DUF305 family [Prauserella marina]
MHSNTSRVVLPAVAFVAIAVLGGCSGTTEQDHTGPSHGASSAQPSTDKTDPAAAHDEADVNFAQQMIPHHQQAIEMADLVESRTDNAELVTLAEQIRQAQGPEIDRLTAWLSEWGQPVDDQQGEGGHGGHGDMPGMSGMMTEEDMAALGSLSGAEFDRRWLEMMIEHHEGAVDMAESELKDGVHTGATELAEDIISAQQAEIDTMNGLLGNR